MERLIRNVTKKFTNLLPKDQLYFTPADLKKLDIPDFLVQRIEVEIYNKLNESIVPPYSDWSDLGADDVKQAWGQFIKALVTEIRMPASKASSVFKSAVTDVAGMILTPRTTIPDILYGSNTSLQKSELENRARMITVNTHLAKAVIKFMNRREKEELDIQTCKQIVEKVDERLTQNNNSEDWLQLLQPLYTLTGPKVDSELFRIFFESRAMHTIAHRFDEIPDYLTQSRFIEILSSEESPDNKASGVKDRGESEAAFAPGDEASKEIKESRTGKKHAYDSSEKTSEIEEKAGEKKEKDKTLKESKSEDDVLADSDTTESEPDEQEDTLLSAFQTTFRDVTDEDKLDSEDTDTFDYAGFQEKEEEPKDEDEPSLYSLFMEEDIEEEEDEDDDKQWSYFTETDSETDSEEDQTTSAQLFEEVDNDSDSKAQKDKDEVTEADSADKKIDLEAEITDKPSHHIEADAADYEAEDESESEPDEDFTDDEVDEAELFGVKDQVEDTADDDTDSPIWQSFLGDEDHYEVDDIEGPEYSPYADIEEDDPIMNMIIEAEKKENAEKLTSWLKKDEKRFVQSIFGGSYDLYQEAITELNSFDSWKHAASYIGKEIFSRNSINMYEDDAVDFTDKLQDYFEKYKSKNV